MRVPCMQLFQPHGWSGRFAAFLLPRGCPPGLLQRALGTVLAGAHLGDTLAPAENQGVSKGLQHSFGENQPEAAKNHPAIYSTVYSV